MQSFEENLVVQWHKKLVRKKTRDDTQGENPESLSQQSLVWYWDVTDRRTDGRTELRQLVRA